MTVRVNTEVPQLRSCPIESASTSTLVPVRSPLVQSRMRSLPVTITRSPLAMERVTLSASCRNALIVYQLVSLSTHRCCDRSNLRCAQARRKVVIRSLSLVMKFFGAVATTPVNVMVSVMPPVLAILPADVGRSSGSVDIGPVLTRLRTGCQDESIATSRHSDPAHLARGWRRRSGSDFGS